jgi:2-methylcitrate dehydratase PrpD
VTATALGIGQRVGASGQEVLAAMVLGYEVAARIGQAITPGFSERGFHGSVITIFGGAVAAGRLLRLTPRQQAQALAIAATSIGGLYAAANSSEAREYHAGLSAMLGIEAALAAGKGFAAEEAIFETRRGFFDTFGARDVEQVTRRLGESWEIATHMAIKLMPGAHPYHAAAEAAAQAATDGNVAPDEIVSITVAARSMGRELVYHPTDLVGMAHSLPYFVAAAAVDRSFTWVHATPEKVLDPVIGRVQDLVRLDPVAERHVEIGRTCGGMVTIETRSGQRVGCTVEAPRGSGLGGIAWAEVDAKYRALLGAAHLPNWRIETSLAAIHALAAATDVNVVTDSLSQNIQR